MSDDIVTLLRELMYYGTFPDESVYGRAVLAAADEIERLRAEIARLGSFLHPVGMVIDGQFSSTSQTKWKRDE